MQDNEIFIIAEIGINHNGSMDLAKKLIDGAVESGCNAVKFQKREINSVYTKEQLDTKRESPWGITNRDQKEGLEFSEEDYDEIDRYCKKKNIDWFASAWDLKSLKFLDKYNLKYNKVASAMLGHKEFIEEVAKRKKYTFISTGMSTLNEIEEVVKIFRKYDCLFELMHCNSTYPMKDEDANLKVIRLLRDTFDCPIGYSCHSTGVILPALAVMYNVTSIEKHITLDRAMYGSDQSASLELPGLKKMVEYVRVAEKAKGKGIKDMSIAEVNVRVKLRRTHDVQ